MALRRETVAYQGKHWTLPLPDGPGKALKMTIHPVREHLPIYLAAVGPKNLELSGEIADGWLAVFFSPEHSGDLLASLKAGRVKADRGTEQDRLAGFDIVPTVPVIINDDLEAAAAPLRAYSALYLGGMGSREKNFYNALAVRMGFAEGAAKVQDLFLARAHREAAAAVPLDFIDQTSLIGPRDRIKDRLSRYAASGVTTLTIAPEGASLDERLHVVRTMAELLDESGLGN
jgi:alkanesulfonate monooxygenase SsuD/methylene tetrahydromethanopterin reductase-like flavin-dependent oxidoreductase (luciferase family)